MNNIKIISVKENPEFLDKAVEYLSTRWKISPNIYHDCIANSLITQSPLPRWYLMLKDTEIIGSYGLITNDFNSRHDLWPWFAALYIEKSERGKALGAQLLEHGRQEAAKLGFPTVYLVTDHVDYYEKYGWQYIADAYDVGGEATRVYEAPARIIETDRLNLRRLAKSDIPAFSKMISTTDFSQYLGSGAPILPGAASRWIAGFDSEWENGYGVFAVTEKSPINPADNIHDTLIGYCGIRTIPDGRVEILYAYDPAAWGKGYATEAGQAIISYAREHFKDITEIIAMAYPQNMGSIGVIKKLGFKSIGQEEHFGNMLDVFSLNI